MPAKQVDALLCHNSDHINGLDATMKQTLDLSHQMLNVLQTSRQSIEDARGPLKQRDEQETEQTSSSSTSIHPIASQVINLMVAPPTLLINSTGISTFITYVVYTLPQITYMRDVYVSTLSNQYRMSSSPMTSYQAPPHGISPNQGFVNSFWISYSFPVRVQYLLHLNKHFYTTITLSTFHTKTSHCKVIKLSF